MSTRIPCECRGYGCGCGANPRDAYVMVDRVDVGRINVCDRCDLTRDTRVGEPVARTEKPGPQQTHEWSLVAIADEARCSCGRAVTGEFLTGVVLERLRVDTAQFQPPCRDALVAFVTERRRPPTGSSRPKDNVTIREASKSAPRFQVKPASEMREGEPFVCAYIDEDLRIASAVLRFRWAPRDHGKYAWTILDTHSPEWKAFDAAWGKAKYGVSYAEPAVLPEIAKPQGPTDAEICARFAEVQRDRGGEDVRLRGGWKSAGGLVSFDLWDSRGWHHDVNMADARAAWSRELARKQAEAREAERQRVACQGDWPGENEFDA